MLVVVLALATLTAALAQDNVTVPLTDLKLAISNGFTAKVKAVGANAVEGTFAKTGEERRLLAVQARPVGKVTGVRALQVTYELNLKSGSAPALAIVAFDKEGGSWYRVGETMASGEAVTARISVQGMRATAFSSATEPELVWNKLSHLWVGFVVDGKAEGSFKLSDAVLTSEPYKPSRPFVVTTGDKPGTWSLSQDPAVKSTVTTPAEGPDGKACMKYVFTVPTGRHMYCIPSVPVAAAELDGYSALRFTYKANVPDGMNGLLVTLQERGGGGYYADPAPQSSAEWKTITLPFSQFKFASWTKDPNGKFDPADIGSVSIGCHGVPKGQGTVEGSIMVTDVQFVP